MDSLVLHETTHSTGKAVEQSRAVSSLDIEESLIAAADALLTSQACLPALSVSEHCTLKPCATPTLSMYTLHSEAESFVCVGTHCSLTVINKPCCQRGWARPNPRITLLRHVQLPSKTSSGVRAKLVAREIDILQRELDTKAVVYIMGRAHMRMRFAKSALEWYGADKCTQLDLTLCKNCVANRDVPGDIHLCKHNSIAKHSAA